MKLLAANGKLLSVQNAGTDAAVLVTARTPPDATGDLPWETIEEAPAPPGYGSNVVTLACRGRFASAQPDGRLEWNRTVRGPWELFIRYGGPGWVGYESREFHRFVSADIGLTANPIDASGLPGCPVVCDRPWLRPWEQFQRVGVSSHMLQGALSVAYDPVAKAHGLQDATGWRRALFMSNFSLARTWYDDPTEGQRQILAMHDAGYMGARAFRALAVDYGVINPNNPWHGREVDPAWSVDVWREILDFCAPLGFRFHLTEGIRWNDALRDELAFNERFYQMVQDAGHAQLIAWHECWNEYWQNTAYGQSDQQVDIGRKMMAQVKAILGAGTLCGLGAAQGNEAPEAFDWASRGGSDVTYIHGTRYMPDAVKRAFGAWYWEGNPGSWPKLVIQGEPTGPGEGVSVARCDDPGYLTALHAMFALTRQTAIAVSGAGIWGRRPVDGDPFFHELPAWLSEIPDEGGVSHAHAPGDPDQIWWWNLSDGRIATALTEGYPFTPPKPIGAFKVIGAFGQVQEGSGFDALKVALRPGYHGALVVAELA